MQVTGSAPKRILFIDLAPSVGGSVISLYQLVQGLDRQRYTPSVVLRRDHGAIPRFESLGIAVYPSATGYTGAMAGASPHWVGVRRGRVARWLRCTTAGERMVHLAGFYLRTWPELRQEAQGLRAILRRATPDLVHLNDVVAVSRSGIMAARAEGIPAICHLRAMSTRTHYDRWLSHSLRGFICISRAVERHESTLGGRVRPSWVVYNGLALDDYDMTAQEAAAIRGRVRAELGYGPEDVVVGCIGRLRPWKGQHIFLRALARLTPEFARLRGLLVGAPERHAPEYGDTLSALAAELGLRDRVTVTGFRNDVPHILRGCDLTVHASTEPEPFGRVIIESMAAGVPVVATNAGAVPEIVEDHVTGLLVTPNDERAMAQGIAYALRHPQERESWQRAAGVQTRSRFSQERNVQGVQAVYEAVLG